MKLNKTQKYLIKNFFTEAGIAYYLNGDWRGVLRRAIKETIGTHKKLFEKLYNCTEEQFEKIISIYIDDLKELGIV
jgi:hypothetical protein